ncbi:MAG: trigger factor [Chloroflexi bacterium]|nr:trigger factor [Chloroflexota bacterium]
MKVTQGEVEERQVTLRIELDDEDLDPYVERGFRQVVGKMRIPGFRPGKAPRRVVEGMVGREGLISESLDFMVADVITKAVEEQEIESVGFPHIENVELDPVVVEAAVALNPVLELGDYRSIRVEEAPAEVSDEDVDQEIEALRKQQSSWEPTDRAVAHDDLVTMNVIGMIGEVKIIDETDSQFMVDPSSTLPLPGFAAELEGLEVDTPSDFTLDVPGDFADNEIAGKQAQFTVTITDVKQRLLPELDDDFAKSVRDECETLDDLKAKLREDIQNATQRQNEHEYREYAIEELVVTADMEIAPLLIQHEIEHMEERREEMMKRLGISEDDYNRFTGKTAEQIREEMHEEAVEKLNRSHALSAFIEQEALEIGDDEVNDRLKQLAREGDESTGQKLTNKELRSERVKASVRESLLIEKALDRLVLIAKGQADDESEEDSSQEEDEAEVVAQSTA